MKNRFLLIMSLVFCISILNASMIHLEKGWDLISTGESDQVDVNKTLSYLDNGSVIWTYNNVDKNWSAKSNSVFINQKIVDNNISFASVVSKFHGFWLYNAGESKDLDICLISKNETVTDPIADAEVYAYSYRNWDNANRGMWGSLRAGYNSTGGESRTYIKFNLSNLSLDTMDKAYLRLQNGAQYDGSDNIDLGIYAVTDEWNEGNGTYHSGEVEPTAPSDQITWNHQPSIDTTLITSFNPSTYNQGDMMKIDITALVKLWRGGLANYGLVIKPMVHNKNSTWIFSSREYPDPTKRPALIVLHTCETNITNSDNFSFKGKHFIMDSDTQAMDFYFCPNGNAKYIISSMNSSDAPTTHWGALWKTDGDNLLIYDTEQNISVSFDDIPTSGVGGVLSYYDTNQSSFSIVNIEDSVVDGDCLP